jgi:hypothetical protein
MMNKISKEEAHNRVLNTFSKVSIIISAMVTYFAVRNGLFGECNISESFESVTKKSTQSQRNDQVFSEHFIEPHYRKIHPPLYETDFIYDVNKYAAPFVNEEYKVIFFDVAKAGSSEWTRFFARLQGNPAWCGLYIHDHKVNQIKKLYDYSRDKAHAMMTDPSWTKAIFVRNPKTRLLSAFLDKAVRNSKKVFIPKYCNDYHSYGGDLQYCKDHHKEFDFFIHNITTVTWENIHWRPIYTRVDDKWWPYMTYIANMENLSDDAERFLRSLKSEIDGVSAWDRVGKSGWGDNEKHYCETTPNSTNAFLAVKGKIHNEDAENYLREYYTPELEKEVEKQYWMDYSNPYFKFTPLKLFSEHSHQKDEIE